MFKSVLVLCALAAVCLTAAPKQSGFYNVQKKFFVVYEYDYTAQFVSDTELHLCVQTFGPQAVGPFNCAMKYSYSDATGFTFTDSQCNKDVAHKYTDMAITTVEWDGDADELGITFSSHGPTFSGKLVFKHADTPQVANCPAPTNSLAIDMKALASPNTAGYYNSSVAYPFGFTYTYSARFTGSTMDLCVQTFGNHKVGPFICSIAYSYDSGSKTISGDQTACDQVAHTGTDMKISSITYDEASDKLSIAFTSHGPTARTFDFKHGDASALTGCNWSSANIRRMLKSE